MECTSTVFLTVMMMLIMVVMPLLFFYKRLKEENELFRDHEEFERKRAMIEDAVILEVAKAMQAYKNNQICAGKWKGSLCTYGDENVGHNVKERSTISDVGQGNRPNFTCMYDRVKWDLENSPSGQQAEENVS